jgi:hypothetical protein
MVLPKLRCGTQPLNCQQTTYNTLKQTRNHGGKVVKFFSGEISTYIDQSKFACTGRLTYLPTDKLYHNYNRSIIYYKKAAATLTIQFDRFESTYLMHR